MPTKMLNEPTRDEISHLETKRLKRILGMCERAAQSVRSGHATQADIEEQIVGDTEPGEFRQFCLSQFRLCLKNGSYFQSLERH